MQIKNKCFSYIN